MSQNSFSLLTTTCFSKLFLRPHRLKNIRILCLFIIFLCKKNKILPPHAVEEQLGDVAHPVVGCVQDVAVEVDIEPLFVQVDEAVFFGIVVLAFGWPASVLGLQLYESRNVF